ncbi:MAG: DNA polymerase Y family protein [Gammaproteobacteria bacterium]|nr:DNA polymerase Y family protein [Gammaproteobacteria bacterium]MBU1414043.1 DNA polymerase Y family protein [Gammaproteobacteria bacterium]
MSLAENALLLEIGGCLRLFGGLDVLRTQVAQGLVEQGIAARMAVAATPQAALWLAEGGGDVLDALAITDLTWPPGVAEKLTRFGLRRLGELRRLTFAALARRIGKPAATLLARAWGEAPDPRLDFVFPLRFDEAIELPAAVENAPALMFAARRLTGALAGWLNVRQAGLRECRLDLVHRQGATPLPLRFAEPTRDGQRFERVLRERLERLQLTAPVERLRLIVDSVEALPGSSGGLFDEGGAKEGMAALVERLRARLGEERVFGIAPVAEHRPECATRQATVGASTASPTPPRPFWLLEKPESLVEIGGRPHRRGPLRLLAGPERIESGWWDQQEGVGDIRRDYFIALTQDQRWAWVFRELRAPGGWYLHGWFA